MSKVAVVYWSSTGNTESMANAVADGAKAAVQKCLYSETADFDAAKVDGFVQIAFGARLWVMRFWKRMSLSRCSVPVRQSFPAKRSGFLDPMAGEMENGCTTGKINAEKMEHFLSQMV